MQNLQYFVWAPLPKKSKGTEGTGRRAVIEICTPLWSAVFCRRRFPSTHFTMDFHTQDNAKQMKKYAKKIQ